MSLTRFVEENISEIKTKEERIGYKKLLMRSYNIVFCGFKKYQHLQQELLDELQNDELEELNKMQTDLFNQEN